MSLHLTRTRWFSHKWLTHHTGIFEVNAVMTSDSISGTVSQSSFSSSTLNIIQPNRSSPLTKGRKEQCKGSYNMQMKAGKINWVIDYLVSTSVTESQLSTYNIGIGSAPEIITNCAPLSVVTKFHSTLVGKETTNQSHVSLTTG